jgi:hypothetical protein
MATQDKLLYIDPSDIRYIKVDTVGGSERYEIAFKGIGNVLLISYPDEQVEALLNVLTERDIESIAQEYADIEPPYDPNEDIPGAGGSVDAARLGL